MSFVQVLSLVHPSKAVPTVSCHTCCRDPHVNTPGSPIPWPFLRLIPPVRPKVQCPWPPTSEAGPLSVCVICTRRDPSATTPDWGRSLTHYLYGQTVHLWLKRPTRYHMLYTLNFDIATDAASRGFPVRKLATSCQVVANPLARNTCAWLVECKFSTRTLCTTISTLCTWCDRGQTDYNTSLPATAGEVTKY